MSDKELAFKAEFDRDLIFEGGHSVRYLAVEVTAPNVVVKREATPLNLAIVIDASGSMGGKPLECAKKAAKGVIEAAEQTDVISIVSFSQDVITHVCSLPMTPKNRRAALDAVELLRTRSSTNLSAGWLKGVECVATFMEEQGSAYHNHVLLLSDGFANEGILDPRELELHATELATRGVYTSTVGIGNDYSSTLLQTLAEYGGGRMHDAERPQEIIEVVLGHLRELQELVVENVTVSVACPYEVRIENVSGMPTASFDNWVETKLGALAALGTRVAIYRLKFKDGNIANTLEFNVKVSWSPRGSSEAEEKSEKAVVTFVSDKDNRGQPMNSRLGMKIARLWQAAVVRNVVELNRAGRYEYAKERLDRELKYLKRYCQILPEADGLRRDLKQLRAVVDREWDERSRKDMQYTTYTTSYGLTDHRTVSRGDWKDSLKGFFSPDTD